MRKATILVDDTYPFTIDVPYTLIETGQKKSEKPVIIYLHGFNDTLERFINSYESAFEKIEAYHLFIQAPYPLYDRTGKKKVDEWGSAWYLYDGDQKQFVKSMEISSKFIENLLKDTSSKIDISRTCLFGYSMGGYLAGYFAFTRNKLINELIVIGARLKTEILDKNWELLHDLQVLAIHGSEDNVVDYKSQRTEIEQLSMNGVNANFKLLDQKHIFNKRSIECAYDWLFKKNYKKI